MDKDKDDGILRIDAGALFGGKSIVTRIKDKTVTSKPQDHSKEDKTVNKK